MPFTTEQFLAVFAEYNQVIWPLQNGLVALGILLVVAAFFPRNLPPRLILAGLSLLWAWMGLVYHLTFFRRINPAATGFGLAFALQAILLGVWAARFTGTFRPAHRAASWVGALLLGYGFVVYPKLATAFGHTFPQRPTFGLPCPTTIVTLGLLLWAQPGAPWWVWTIPLLWSGIGGTAAFLLGIREDWGLVLAGVMVVITLAHGKVQRRRHRLTTV